MMRTSTGMMTCQPPAPQPRSSSGQPARRLQRHSRGRQRRHMRPPRRRLPPPLRPSRPSLRALSWPPATHLGTAAMQGMQTGLRPWTLLLDPRHRQRRQVQQQQQQQQVHLGPPRCSPSASHMPCPRPSSPSSTATMSCSSRPSHHPHHHSRCRTSSHSQTQHPSSTRWAGARMMRARQVLLQRPAACQPQLGHPRTQRDRLLALQRCRRQRARL